MHVKIHGRTSGRSLRGKEAIYKTTETWLAGIYLCDICIWNWLFFIIWIYLKTWQIILLLRVFHQTTFLIFCLFAIILVKRNSSFHILFDYRFFPNSKIHMYTYFERVLWCLTCSCSRLKIAERQLGTYKLSHSTSFISSMCWNYKN